MIPLKFRERKTGTPSYCFSHIPKYPKYTREVLQCAGTTSCIPLHSHRAMTLTEYFFILIKKSEVSLLAVDV
jgi:hypothetical protein